MEKHCTQTTEHQSWDLDFERSKKGQIAENGRIVRMKA